MKKKILGIFDRRPVIWFHYILLTGVLFAAFYIGDSILNDFRDWVWYYMFAWFFIFISIGDQIIHKILGAD